MAEHAAKTGIPGKTIYRSMRLADDGGPMMGPTARTLGARPGPEPGPGVDIPVRDGMVQPDVGGMSVAADDPMNLPRMRRPPEFGGTGKDPVWSMNTNDLGPDLVCRPDPDAPSRHWFVEPAREMTYEEYREALEATKGYWQVAAP